MDTEKMTDRKEPIGMFATHCGVNAHVIGNHIGRETNAARPGTGAQLFNASQPPRSLAIS
jgi:hypothetical protein